MRWVIELAVLSAVTIGVSLLLAVVFGSRGYSFGEACGAGAMVAWCVQWAKGITNDILGGEDE